MDFAIGHHSPLIEACAAFLGFVDQRGGASVRGEVVLRCIGRRYDQSLHAFLPYDRRWIKHKMFQHLKWLAQQ
uniref:Uncharacterized protein n=1 Tax=Leersia perrieri TaxID=77586 RepID=A0A0D9W6S1_9ORYZ